MKKALMMGGLLLGSVLVANARDLVDPCGSPKEFYSKYMLDKCYKVYFDAISEAKKKAEEASKQSSDALNKASTALDKASKLEAIIKDHENRIRNLEARPLPAPQPKKDEGVGVYKWQLEEVGTVKFDFDKFDIRKDQVSVLNEIAEKVKADGREVLVVGFADKVGSSKYNFNLSLWRAQRVASELAKRGVDIGKINIAGYGKEVYELLDPKNRTNQRVVKVYIKK